MKFKCSRWADGGCTAALHVTWEPGLGLCPELTTESWRSWTGLGPVSDLSETVRVRNPYGPDGTLVEIGARAKS